mgnify:CR=1 FL=1
MFFSFILIFSLFLSFGQSFDEKIEQLINDNLKQIVKDKQRQKYEELKSKDILV